jgi:succinyl-CoA synthetase beta subunit
VANTVALVGQLMLARPELAEIDINPLIVYPKDRGVIAVDALLVAA